MSLIAGIHLSKHLYLISDSRVSYKNDVGEVVSHEDNLIKTIPLSNYTAVSAAGSAQASAYLLTRLKERIQLDASIDEVISTFRNNLRSLISEYVNNTGNLKQSAGLIVAGFNPYKKKVMNATKVGEILSAPFISEENQFKQQRIDQRIIRPLGVKILENSGELDKDTIFETELEASSMYSIEIDIETAQFEIKEVQCFELTSHEPSKESEILKIPSKDLARLEAPLVGEEVGITADNFEDFLFDEISYVLSFVQRHIESRKFGNVGGYLFTGIVVPISKDLPYLLFPAGTQAFYDNTTKKVKIVGNLEIDPERKFVYTEEGVTKKFKSLEDYLYNKADMDLGPIML